MNIIQKSLVITNRETNSKTAAFFWGLLAIILFPFIVVVGLIIMLFAATLALWQRLTISKEELQKRKDDKLRQKIQNETWSVFSTIKSLKIEKQLAGSLPWGSGDYFHLASDPKIPYLENKLFGDWLTVDFNGVFLQKWNHPRNINCDLVFIDADSLQVTELKKGIPSKDWRAQKTASGTIAFTFVTLDYNSVYEVGPGAEGVGDAD